MGKLHTLVKLSWFGLEWYTLFNEPSLLLVDEPQTRHFTLTNRPALRVVPPVGSSGTPKGLRGKKATRRQRRQKRLQKKQSKREELPVDEYYQEKPKKNSRKNRKRKASKSKSSSKRTTVIPSPIPLPSDEDEDYYYATHQPARLRSDQTEVFVGFPSDDEDELEAQQVTPATSQPNSSLETEKIQRLEDELKRLREALTTLNDGLANQKKNNEEKQHPQMMMWPQWNGSMYLPVPPPNTSSFLTPIDHESANRFRRIPAFQFSDDEDDNGASNNRRYISSSSSSSSSSYSAPSERDFGFVDMGSFVPVPSHSPPPPPPPSAQSPESLAALSPILRNQEEKKAPSSPSVISKTTKAPPPPPPMPSTPSASSSSINKSSSGIPVPPPMMTPSSSAGAATPKRFSLMSPEPRAKAPAQSTPSSSAAMSSLLSDPKVWEQKLSSLRRVTEEDREKLKKQREKEKMVATSTRPLSAADMIASALARKFQFARGSPPSSPESSSDWDSPSEKENGSPSKVGPRKLVITDLASSPLKRSFSPIRSLSPSTSSSPFSRVPSSTSQLHVFSDASSGAMAITDS